MAGRPRTYPRRNWPGLMKACSRRCSPAGRSCSELPRFCCLHPRFRWAVHETDRPARPATFRPLGHRSPGGRAGGLPAGADFSGIVALGLPLLALGSGADLLLSHAGSPAPAERLPGGLAEIRVDAARPLFSGLTEQQQVLLEGGVHEPGAAPGFTVAARLEDGTPAAFISEERRTAALLFHPEADLTENGMQMLQNFLERLAGLDRNYVLEDRIETALGDIREQVGDRPVFALVSGGVDS